MRILIVGAGAIGGYFGARLIAAGRDVTFLVRERRAEQLRRDGLNVTSPLGDLNLPPPALTSAATLKDFYGLIVLSSKSYDLEASIDDFAAGVGPGSRVLPLLNGLRHLDVLDARFGAQVAPRALVDEHRLLAREPGKLDISRDLLYKAAKLTEAEYEEVKLHVQKGITMLEPVGGSLRRVLPIILSHHDRFDGQGYTPKSGDDIPLESRILAVADAYDAMTSDRPYRKAMSPYEARDVINSKVNAEFDPAVVKAFNAVFGRHEMEIPEVVV